MSLSQSIRLAPQSEALRGEASLHGILAVGTGTVLVRVGMDVDFSSAVEDGLAALKSSDGYTEGRSGRTDLQ